MASKKLAKEPVTKTPLPMPSPEEETSIPYDEAARVLTAMGSLLRSGASKDSDGVAQSLDQAASVARVHIGNTAEAKGEGEKDALPTWAQNVPHPETLFVHETPQLELWHAIAKNMGRNETDVLVGYRHLDDELNPGGTENEQAIPLEMADNRFTLDEWQIIAEPILDRYVKALELKKLLKLMGKEKEEISSIIKNILPQVFHQGEVKPNEVDAASQQFRKHILELVNSINTNPEVLKSWILEQMEEMPKTIAPHRSDKDKSPRESFEQLHRQTGVKRIKQRLQQETLKETQDDYVTRLADKISKLGGQLLMLNTRFAEGVYSSPEVKKDFVETPYIKKILEQLAEMSAKQLEQKKGMVSLIGDMGTGKNYVVEHFAAKTHRPYFYFPCSRGMDAADLGFHFEFRKGESITVPSQLAKGLRTKNAVILIDEPNALPPEVVSALHGLADHNRTFVYNGVKFEAAEGVVIVMAMNPATYAHVKDLPEAFSDRTLGMDMRLDYPPLTKLDELAQNSLMSKAEREKALQEDNTLDKKFVCDEALILRGQFPSLKKWGDEEFAKLWDVVANGASAASLGEKAKELDALRPDVEVLFKILKICDAWRKKYQAGDMQRTISLRGSTAVAENYLRIHDVRKAFLDLYKPNSLKFDGGREDYETLEQVLNDLGELEKQINKEGA